MGGCPLEKVPSKLRAEDGGVDLGRRGRRSVRVVAEHRVRGSVCSGWPSPELNLADQLRELELPAGSNGSCLRSCEPGSDGLGPDL